MQAHCKWPGVEEGSLGQEVGELLQGLLLEAGFLPQVRCQEVVRRLQRREGRLHPRPGSGVTTATITGEQVLRPT